MVSKCMRILLLFAALAIAPAYGFTPSFETKFEDISPGEIRVILQDRQGFIWLGGRGAVLRYDAYKFRNIQSIEQRGGVAKAVNPYYVTDMMQDSAGTLWITSHKGLYRYNADQEILERPKSEDGSINPLFEIAMQDIQELPNGEMMIGGDGLGLVIFDRKTSAIIWQQQANQADANSAPAVLERTIQRLFIDSKQRIWVANNRGLNLFDRNTKAMSLFVPNPDNPNSKADNALLSIVEDKFGRLLGGTLGKGLYAFDPDAKTFRHYVNNPADPTSLPEDGIWKIFVDAEKKIWLGHTRSGFSWFDEQTDKFTRFDYAFGQPGAPVYGAVRAIFEDNNNNIWLGNFPGTVSFHDRSTSALTVYKKIPDRADSMSDNNVQRVAEDQQGRIWMAVGDGINVINRQTNQVKRYTQAQGNYPARGSLSIYIDKNNTVWVGTWAEGFYRYDTQSDKFIAMPFNAGLAGAPEKTSPTLNDATVWGFCETKKGEFWITTHYAGINRYDRATGLFTKYRNDTVDTSLANNIAWGCLEDSKERLWIGTANGLSRLDPGQERFKNYRPQEGNAHALQAGVIEDIYEDAKGRLWFTTAAGLHLFREETDDFVFYSMDDGFDNNTIRTITGDRLGNIWMGTNNGLIQFNPETKKVRNYLSVNGKKIGGVNNSASLLSAKGEVVFGTTGGLLVVDIEHLKTNRLAPPIAFTDFKIFAQSVFPIDKNPALPASINKLDQIELSYEQKMISLEFAALNYRDPDKNRYAYMLEGFDKDWLEVGSVREAQYTNLSPGEYIFKVRASNNDGVWSEQPRSIRIVQLPPPWKTWWAYLIYSLIILCTLGYVVMRQRHKRIAIELQNKLLEIKVAERTRDLDQKNQDIQTLLANMGQGLFSVGEGSLVLAEYSTHLESILDTRSIVGRRCVDLLFEHAHLGADKVQQQEACLHSIIGFERLCFDLNADLLISEYEIVRADMRKFIALDWSPIVDADDVVQRLMVSARDVTLLRSLEREARAKKRDLAIIEQLLSVSAESFTVFYASLMHYLESCRHSLGQLRGIGGDAIQSVFRNLHTIKGNSRAHGFTLIADAAHNAETNCARGQLDIDQLAGELDFITAVATEYYTLHANVLKRGGTADTQDGLWVPRTIFADLQQKVNALRQIAPHSYSAITKVLNKIFASPIAEVIAAALNSLPELAAQLGKPAPVVKIDDQGILIKDAAHGLLRDIFAHLLRNSIDHGLEAAAVRQAKHKNAAGLISITLRLSDKYLHIELRDDGAGLNLKHLHDIAMHKGLLTNRSILSRIEVANVLFAPGFSTKEEVSSISGRGVGLDAVRHYVVDFGGEISIEFSDAKRLFSEADCAENVNFAFVISLPRVKSIYETKLE